MAVKNKLRLLLESRGLTIYRFQREVGIAQRTAYGLVNNPGQLPSSTVLGKICAVYKIQPSEVLEWVASAAEPDCE